MEAGRPDCLRGIILLVLLRCKFEVFLTAENRDHFTENLPETFLLENLTKTNKAFCFSFRGKNIVLALVFLVIVLGITIEKLTPVCIDKRNSWLRFAGGCWCSPTLFIWFQIRVEKLKGHKNKDLYYCGLVL